MLLTQGAPHLPAVPVSSIGAHRGLCSPCPGPMQRCPGTCGALAARELVLVVEEPGRARQRVLLLLPAQRHLLLAVPLVCRGSPRIRAVPIGRC